MPKIEKIYLCSNCDAQFPKWLGRCNVCEAWGTIQVSSLNPKETNTQSFSSADTTPLSSIQSNDIARLKTGIEEFDRVLGGGMVPSSLVLIGGEPGIGKSTLILQVADTLNKNVLYVSGEESGFQIKMRADRLGFESKNIDFLGQTHLETICKTIEETKPALAIIDSIQTLYSTENPSEAGSVNQIRVATVKLLEVAKKQNTTIFVIGHVTKDGSVAGPKTLEHLVDTVVYLEGDRHHIFRLLRTVKNRFGSTNEVGVFEMTNKGLEEVKDPSLFFLRDKTSQNPGTVLTPTVEGTRIFITEIQALLTKSIYATPQRKSLGFDLNRLNVLTAVLAKRANISIGSRDLYLNIVGGLKIVEPAVDLAVSLALVSAEKNIIVPKTTLIFGEVGLSGEVRKVNLTDQRIKEAQKLGFKTIIMPKSDVRIKTSCDLQMVETIQKAVTKIS